MRVIGSVPMTTIVEDSDLQTRANRLIKFQLHVLESLQSGEDPKAIAQSTRDFLVNTYAHGDSSATPSGADLGLSVNRVCNLRCPHCYYANTHIPDNTEEGSLDENGWRDIVSQAIELGIDHISILGKEPLLSPAKTRAILETVDEKRRSGLRVRPELITNGTLIKDNIEWLSQHPDFYFFSISFDGYNEDHDRIRGEGAYNKSKEGLRTAKDEGIHNLAAIFTAMPHNVSSLERMAEDLSSVGLEYLSVGYCFPTDHNQQDLTAGIELFRRTWELGRNLPPNLRVSLNLMGDEHAQIIHQLYQEGFFSLDQVGVTEDLAPSLIVPLVNHCSENNPAVLLNCTFLPTMFYSGFRIDYNGTAIDFCSDLRTEEKRGFGDVNSNTVAELYRKSKDLWPKYTEKYYKRLSKIFRGEDVGPVGSWYDLPEVK
jgi:pyruvate-formate lyase-activating enzyme